MQVLKVLVSLVRRFRRAVDLIRNEVDRQREEVVRKGWQEFLEKFMAQMKQQFPIGWVRQSRFECRLVVF